MVRVAITVRKSLDENAAVYFERAKKAKRKLEGVRSTITRFEKATGTAATAGAAGAEAGKTRRKKEWYEQYRWSFTTDGHLIIAGRDASSNESIIK
jgi:predicted ribosome quality control (RQC) complex YloA/Tae2 family protein